MAVFIALDPMSANPTFDHVVEELGGSLRRYLTRLAGNAETAEDLLQETLTRINRGLERFEQRASLKTWTFTIATRVAADHFRASRNKLNIIDLDEMEMPADPAPDADERLVVDEMSSCVREVIDTLPDDYRAALVLHDLEGMTAAETAAVCGCSLATAKIRIHRARARLKEALENECTFYRDNNGVFRCDRADRH